MTEQEQRIWDAAYGAAFAGMVASNRHGADGAWKMSITLAVNRTPTWDAVEIADGAVERLREYQQSKATT